jgi:hypothetical protein
MTRSAIVFFAAVALIAGASAVPARAQPVPSVANSLVSVQRGQTLELIVTGSNLASVASTGMREPQGLEATLVKAEKPEDGKVRLKLVAAPDAVPGEREVRLVSATGVSNLLRVVVEQYPLLAESEPNDNPRRRLKGFKRLAQAQVLGRTYEFERRVGSAPTVSQHTGEADRYLTRDNYERPAGNMRPDALERAVHPSHISAVVVIDRRIECNPEHVGA